jgi:hypothetical protein
MKLSGYYFTEWVPLHRNAVRGQGLVPLHRNAVRGQGLVPLHRNAVRGQGLRLAFLFIKHFSRYRQELFDLNIVFKYRLCTDSTPAPEEKWDSTQQLSVNVGSATKRLNAPLCRPDSTFGRSQRPSRP